MLLMSNVFVAPADVKYNAEKEEKAKQERKQRQLEAVELTWQIEVEKKKKNGIPLIIYLFLVGRVSKKIAYLFVVTGLFQVDNLLLLFVSSSDHQSTYTSTSVLQTATVLVAVTSRKSFCLSLQKWMPAMPLTSTMRHIVRGLVFYNFRLPEDDFKRKLGQEPCMLDINIVTQITADGFDWLSLSMTTSH